MTLQKIFLFAGSMDGGGSERQTLLLLERLDRRRWQPCLKLLYRRGVLLNRVPADVSIEAYWDSHVVPSLWLPGRILRQQVAWLRQSLIKERPVVLYDRTYHATLVTAPASKELPVRRVSTITGPPSREVISGREPWAWFKRRRLARAYRSADVALAVSDSSARDAETFYGLPKGFVKTFPNPIDLPAVIQESRNDLPLQLDSSKTHFACIGRMTPEKGHSMLIDAFHQVLQRGMLSWHLWLAGDGPLRTRLESQVTSLGMSHHVTFLGHLPEATRLIARCDLLCLPSHYEGLPNVVMEAMALGIPVIATDAGGTRELAIQDAITLIPPDNRSAFAASLMTYLKDPAGCQQQVLVAQRVIARRDIGALMPQLEAIFDNSESSIRADFDKHART